MGALKRTDKLRGFKKASIVLFLLVLILAGIAFIGCVNKPNGEVSEEKVEDNLVILKKTAYSYPVRAGGHHIIRIQGVVRNKSDKTYYKILVKAKTYDEEDVLIGTGKDAIKEIQGKEEATFEIKIYTKVDVYGLDWTYKLDVE